MNLVKHSWFLSCALIAGLIASPAMAQNSSETRAATQSEIIGNCQSCHGAGGDSKVTSTPRLNGQQEAYLVQRLKQFSNVTRSNPHAKIGMFTELSKQNDTTRVSIAKHFASQSPSSPKPGAQAAEGKLIYEKGIAAENVIACNQCHGAQGEGHGLVPRIAGQHADYLRAQLRLFGIKFREHILMNPNTKTMTGNTAEALVSYLAND
jgi:cytochrome c553